MKREYHRWHSPRLGIELGVVVYGHWGTPLVGFPTSAGDDFELEGQGMLGALAAFIEGRKVKFYSVHSINGLSFYNKEAHPFHRSWVQAVWDAYFREEVVPFIWSDCQTPGIAISTMGASFGAYHAANLVFKKSRRNKPLVGMVGLLELKNFLERNDGDQLFFKNPVEYLSN